MYVMRRLCISLAALLLMEQAGLCGLLCALPVAGQPPVGNAMAVASVAEQYMPCHGAQGSPSGTANGSGADGSETPGSRDHNDGACCEQSTILAAGRASAQLADASNSLSTATVALLASVPTVSDARVLSVNAAIGPPGKFKRRPLYILNASFLA
jgi:hypothetical protein